MDEWMDEVSVACKAFVFCMPENILLLRGDSSSVNVFSYGQKKAWYIEL